MYSPLAVEAEGFEPGRRICPYGINGMDVWPAGRPNVRVSFQVEIDGIEPRSVRYGPCLVM